jgi:DNA-binding NarL/FixJ family response regulator
MSTNTASDAIRIVLVDDHLVVRAGLRALLGSVADIRIVGEAANGQEALELIDRVTPDVAVLDLDMPVMGGRAVLESLVARQSPTRVLVLTMHDDVEHLAALLEAGAAGYLVKTAADRDLVDARLPSPGSLVSAIAASTMPRTSTGAPSRKIRGSAATRVAKSSFRNVASMGTSGRGGRAERCYGSAWSRSSCRQKRT